MRNGGQRFADTRSKRADRCHCLPECSKKSEKAADVLEQFALQECSRREDDEGCDQWIRCLKDAEGIRGPLRCEESPLLRGELPRPHAKCTRNRIRNAQLSYSSDELQHEAANLALVAEVFVLVIEAYRADGSNQKCSDQRQ